MASTSIKLATMGLLASLAACSGGSSDEIDAPSCAAGEVRIEGTVGGVDRASSISGANSFAFVNALSADTVGSLDIGFPTGETLSLEWPTLVANGDSVEARGSVALPGVDLGNCATEGFTGLMSLSAEGTERGAFRLTELREGAGCGSALDGELRGCWQKQE